MDLLRATVDSLLLGRALDAGAWRSMLEAMPRPGGEEDAGAERSLAVLARMMAVEETRDLEAMAKSIPPAHEPLASLAAAVASSRTLNAASAASLSAYVRSAFALIPYLSERGLVKPVLQRLAGLQGKAIELGGEPLDLPAASMFTLLANTLAKGHEDPSFLDGALALVDRLRACPAGMGRYAVAGNLVTTFKQLARYRPAEMERYLLGGLELTTQLYEARHEIARLHPDPNIARTRQVDWLKNLMFLRTELARLNPARAAEHAAAAWQDVARLRQLAEELGDPDLRREAMEAERYVGDRTGAAPGLPASPPAAELPSAEELTRRLSEAAFGAQEAARATLALPEGAPRRAAVVQYLERLYLDLARALHPVIQELGVNHHVSRVLLALGAVASGRLWPLSWPAVQASVIYLPGQVGPDGPLHRYEQEIPSRHLFELGMNYPSIACAVAAFSDALSGDAELAGVLGKVLRAQNQELLERLLPAAVQPQHVRGRQMSVTDDVTQIALLISSFSGYHEPRRRPEGGAMNAGSKPVDEAPFLSPDAPAAPDGPFDFERWLAPERMIGKVISFWHLPTRSFRDGRIDSIVGQGTEKVVFGMTVPDTGEGFCLALFRTAFGPRKVLREYLNRVSAGRETYDPRTVLAICDAGLASGDMSFAFTKGIALAQVGDLAGASDALDVALDNAPDDLECLIHKASVLSLLGQHSGSVMYLARASRLHPDALRQFLGHETDFRDQLASSVDAVLQADPRRIDASELKRDAAKWR